MSTNKTRNVLLVTGIVLAVVVTACSGRFHQRDPERHAAWLMEKATDELALDTAQQAKFKIFTDGLTESRRNLRSQRQQSHQTLSNLLQQEKFERNKAKALVREHLLAMQGQAPKLVDAFADFYDTLKPQQRNKLREHMNERFEHHQGKHHW